MTAPSTPNASPHQTVRVMAIDPACLIGRHHALIDTRARSLPPIPGARKRSTGTGASGDESIVVGNIAVVPIFGIMTKSGGFGTSTIAVRTQLDEMSSNPDIAAALLWIDSPGGNVAGTLELADAIRAFGQKKLVHVFAEDVAASAAYWAATGASRITSNAMAQVGSIGVFAVVDDSAKEFERMGVKRHLIASGDAKGLGIDGIAIPESYLREVRETIAEFFQPFKQAVLSSRKIPTDKQAEVLSGKIFTARKAMQLGLIDGIETLAEAVAELKGAAARRTRFKRGY
jgi:signal peptide peptidase SppA